jgi:hypothetical protein
VVPELPDKGITAALEMVPVSTIMTALVAAGPEL